ncbi:unnamed protein product [Periconia digitata]|uniref:Uncharacterized protein n=1 Tax=Periconia digitata TaxID=1303443 RepID=A0A9W4U397_9PLEO|nr:unnamed protein product [Periconia digitata]
MGRDWRQRTNHGPLALHGRGLASVGHREPQDKALLLLAAAAASERERENTLALTRQPATLTIVYEVFQNSLPAISIQQEAINSRVFLFCPHSLLCSASSCTVCRRARPDPRAPESPCLLSSSCNSSSKTTCVLTHPLPSAVSNRRQSDKCSNRLTWAWAKASATWRAVLAPIRDRAPGSSS